MELSRLAGGAGIFRGGREMTDVLAAWFSDVVEVLCRSLFRARSRASSKAAAALELRLLLDVDPLLVVGGGGGGGDGGAVELVRASSAL